MTHTFLIIQHLLRDFLAFAKALRELDVDPADVFIVGIPYSSKRRTVLGLKQMGFSNVWAPKDYPFYGEVETALGRALDRAAETRRKLVVIEDGGYAVPMLHSRYPGKIELVHGAVEQTANGIWADAELAKQDLLRIPVLNVAQSDIKGRLESPLIGQAVVDNIRNLLKLKNRDIMNKDVLVLGYGSIGRRVADSLRANHVNKVVVTDIVKERREEATAAGFHVLEYPPADAVRGFSIVVGCTGKQGAEAPLGHASLRSLDHHSTIVNATSKKSEINYAHLDSLAISTRMEPGYGTEYNLADSSITLLANGFPVNFFGDSESVTDSAIQFIPALILGCAGYLTQRELPPRIHDVPMRLQKEIEQVHNSETRR